MPSYQLTKEWSAPIPVAAGDYAQNKSGGDIAICAVEPASINDALVIPKREAILIENATNIRARLIELESGSITIAKGF